MGLVHTRQRTPVLFSARSVKDLPATVANPKMFETLTYNLISLTPPIQIRQQKQLLHLTADDDAATLAKKFANTTEHASTENAYEERPIGGMQDVSRIISAGRFQEKLSEGGSDAVVMQKYTLCFWERGFYYELVSYGRKGEDGGWKDLQPGVMVLDYDATKGRPAPLPEWLKSSDATLAGSRSGRFRPKATDDEVALDAIACGDGHAGDDDDAASQAVLTAVDRQPSLMTSSDALERIGSFEDGSSISRMPSGDVGNTTTTPVPTEIFVGNLPPDVCSDDLAVLFQHQCTRIIESEVSTKMMDSWDVPGEQYSKTHAIIMVPSAKDAANIIHTHDKAEYNGRALRVEVANAKYLKQRTRDGILRQFQEGQIHCRTAACTEAAAASSTMHMWACDPSASDKKKRPSAGATKIFVVASVHEVEDALQKSPPEERVMYENVAVGVKVKPYMDVDMYVPNDRPEALEEAVATTADLIAPNRQAVKEIFAAIGVDLKDENILVDIKKPRIKAKYPDKVAISMHITVSQDGVYFANNAEQQQFWWQRADRNGAGEVVMRLNKHGNSTGRPMIHMNG